MAWSVWRQNEQKRVRIRLSSASREGVVGCEMELGLRACMMLSLRRRLDLRPHRSLEVCLLSLHHGNPTELSILSPSCSMCLLGDEGGNTHTYTDTHTSASTHRTTHVNTQTHVHRSEYTRVCTHRCTHMWTHRTTHMLMCLYTGSHLCTHVNPPPTCVHTHRDTQAMESGEEGPWDGWIPDN